MIDTLLSPALSDRLLQLLADFLPTYAAEGGAYSGLLLEGLPIGQWLPELLDKLAEDDRWHITLVGFTAAEEKSLLTNPAWPRVKMGVEQAIATRHNRPSSSWHLVVLRGAREPRLHSLTQRGYGIIGPDEVARFGAQQQSERSPNVPQARFWHFLAQPLGGISLPLLGTLEMLNYAASSDHPNLYTTLPLLDLLPDKQLFENTEKLPVRLHENAALVARLQEQDPADLRRAFEVGRSVLDPQEAVELREAYAAFARLAPGQAVREWADSMPLERARQLLLSPLNGKPAPPFPPLPGTPPINPASESDDQPGNGGQEPEGGTVTPPGGYEPGSGPDGPETDDDNDDDITTLGTRTRAKVNARPARPKLEASLDEAVIRRAAEISPAELMVEATLLTKDLRRNLRKFADGKLAKTNWLLQSTSCYVDHPHEKVSARLTQAFCGPDLLGGRLELPAGISLSTIARADLTPVTTDMFGPAYQNKLRQALTNLAPLLAKGIDAASLLDKWLAARELLAREADLLTAAPLATLLTDPNMRVAARASQDAYRDLCQILADHYDVLRREGADVVLPDVLRVDTVEVRTNGKDAGIGDYVLLAPLHPLVLWKYAELADVLEDQANNGAGKNLHDLLPEWPESMVEPLRAVVIPDAVGRVQQLAFAGRCGTWPEYQPSGTIRERSSGGLLVVAAHKLALLYPAIADQLRVIIHHPSRLEGFTRDLRTLLAPKARPEKPVFRRLHLTLTYPPGGRPFPLPIEWAGWLREGELIVEQTERGDLRPGIQVAPAHLLLVPATYRIDNLQVAREPSSLHPLSLPRRLRYQTYRERPILEPRSQQSDDTKRYPFGAFHELVSRFGGRPDQEASGMLTPEVPPEHLPTVLTGTVWAILPEHPYPLSDEQLALKHDTTQHGQMVITGQGRRFRDRVKWMLEQMDYVPKSDKLTTLLRHLDGVGQTGLFHLISSKDPSGFSDTALKGQFGLAVALRWYEQNEAKSPYHVVLSLDSALARRWLCKRETNQRTDLLGIRYDSEGNWHVDLIEVKAYAVPNPDNGSGSPGEQLRAMAKVLLPILRQTGGDLLTDCRRELLREQLYLEGKEYLKGPDNIEPKEWAMWIDQLDALLNGTQKASLNLLLLEVNLNLNEDPRRDSIPGDLATCDEAYRRELIHWHINQPDIKLLVSDLVTPTPHQRPLHFLPFLRLRHHLNHHFHRAKDCSLLQIHRPLISLRLVRRQLPLMALILLSRTPLR
ncbi:hypothetical protein [Hymenobacter sp. HDW8]|uniref:hypothetical protein n=1 Tax=Hymenobacter sp. HDW8 TaxID=2714932 RepID=UPI00140AE8E6|nr:hypothetical protein [Hymenobacter sp. HDW8]QIL78390.1 hypothetical protein G7064_21450 [Hymenobacter sp. HDW8]